MRAAMSDRVSGKVATLCSVLTAERTLRVVIDAGDLSTEGAAVSAKATMAAKAASSAASIRAHSQDTRVKDSSAQSATYNKRQRGKPTKLWDRPGQSGLRLH